MKFLKNLLGQEDDKPKWDIKPPEQRPAPRRRAAAADECAQPAKKKEPNPFLDDSFEDMEIVNETSPAEMDPYASNAWKYDQEADTRKLKTLHIGSATDKEDKDPDFNPYDTGVFRRGWKD